MIRIQSLIEQHCSRLQTDAQLLCEEKVFQIKIEVCLMSMDGIILMGNQDGRGITQVVLMHTQNKAHN